jgi:hypothetical protein
LSITIQLWYCTNKPFCPFKEYFFKGGGIPLFVEMEGEKSSASPYKEQLNMALAFYSIL